MDIDAVVRVDGRDAAVTVRADVRATVGDLRLALAGMPGLPSAPIGITGPGGTPARLDDRMTLVDAGLRQGATVHLLADAQPTAEVASDVPVPLEVAVVGGLHAGPATGLPPGGTATVGRAPTSELPIPDGQVSRSHLEVRADASGTSATVADRGSANGTRLGAWRLADGTTLTGHEVIGVGESVVAVRARTASRVELAVEPATGDRLFNRPPRITAPDRLPELLVPVAPAPPRGFRFPWLATLMPLLLGLVLYFVLPDGYGVYLVLMMALSPLMAVVNLVGDRRSERREYATAKAAYELARAGFEVALVEAVASEERAVRQAHPDPAELARRAGSGVDGVARGPAATLWQRRRTDPDFLNLRIGLVDRPARLVLRPDPASGTAVRDADQPATPTVHDVPLVVDLPQAGVLGVAGPRQAALPAGRALLAQAAVLHAPVDLGIVIVTGRDDADDWEWATWLPHTASASSAFDCARMVATDGAQAEARLAELRRLIDERSHERRSSLADGPPAGRAVLVVLDGARRLRDLPGLAEVLASGPAVGVYALCLDTDENALPDECGATVVAAPPAGTRARVSRKGYAPVEDVLVDGLVAGLAAATARALAPIRLHGERAGDGALPDRVRFLDLAGLATVNPAAVRARWQASPQGRATTALLGMSADGPINVDLRRDGPHGLVAGTTGAGKSELLQTLISSLALANQPDALTFVLVDYKGGSAFAACAELPHCVGLITDLDGHFAARALDSLSAELRRRETLFARARVKDLEDYWAATADRLPRLVIVVDEFATLVEEVPDFVTGVVGIGMRGRSLGVHVVLATQRPAGVVTADLRANLNLRISLRVTAPAESMDIVDTPDAAQISPRQPGRAYLRTGHGELTPFQAARVAWPRPATDALPAGPRVQVTERRVRSLGQPAAAAPAAEENGPTDLTDLVAAIRDAARGAGLASPPRPWLPPLPDRVPLNALTGLAGAGMAEGQGPVTAVLGLVDRPSSQAQDAFVIDLERTGPLAVAGAVRAGRSTVLRTLAAVLAAGSSPADLHLYGLDCGNRALAPLAGLPHCGAVVSGEDSARVTRLLAHLSGEASRRQRVLSGGGYGSLAEQRAAAPGEALPYLVLLLDRLEAFVDRYGEVDGGHLVDQLEGLLRTGPAVGVTVVLATDRTGFGHRIASAVGARLVMRQATTDDAIAFSLDPRTLPRHMPPGRAVWAATGEEVQIALLDADPAGGAQAKAVDRLAVSLAARWTAVHEERLPQRMDPLPDRMSSLEAEALRRTARRPVSAICTPAVGGDHLGPVDVDLADAGGAFLIAGPQRSGRSTALAAIVTSLAGRADGSLPVLVVAPRPSPVRDLAALPGVLGVLTEDSAGIAARLADHVDGGPLALVVDDGELLTDRDLSDPLEAFARDARDRGSLLVAGATTEDVLASPYRGWLAAIRRSRCGVLLNPASHVDGEVFGLRLPRSVNGGWPPGRGLLVLRGETAPVQILEPLRAESAVHR